jgi:hypothetical protein
LLADSCFCRESIAGYDCPTIHGRIQRFASRRPIASQSFSALARTHDQALRFDYSFCPLKRPPRSQRFLAFLCHGIAVLLAVVCDQRLIKNRAGVSEHGRLSVSLGQRSPDQTPVSNLKSQRNEPFRIKSSVQGVHGLVVRVYNIASLESMLSQEVEVCLLLVRLLRLCLRYFSTKGLQASTRK